MVRPDFRTASRCGVIILLLPLILPRVVLAQQSPQPAPLSQVESALREGNFSQAAGLLQRRAEAGDPEAQYLLASLYRSGRGVEQDDGAAYRWMKAAAEKGHAKAQFNLARMYLEGRGVVMDVRQARVWLAKASALGHLEASKLLAEISTERRVALHSSWATTVAIEKPQPPGSANVPAKRTSQPLPTLLDTMALPLPMLDSACRADCTVAAAAL